MEKIVIFGKIDQIQSTLKCLSLSAKEKGITTLKDYLNNCKGVKTL